MKTKLLLALVFNISISVWSQEPKARIKQIAEEIETMVKTEKLALTKAIENIEKRFDNKEINSEEAEKLKKDAAGTTAKKIELFTEEKAKQIAEITKELVNNSLKDSIPIEKKDSIISGLRIERIKPDKSVYQRTVNNFVFALGINNILQNNVLGSINDSPYDLWNSNFLELGWGYKTAFSKESSLVNLTYGVSFQWNELKLFNNQYHVDAGDYTQIITHSEQLKKSKLRNTSIIVPVGLEFDFSGKKEVDGKMVPVRDKSVKIGFGGYAGLKINTKQILKYNPPREQKKQKIVADYNTNNLIFGIMGSIGYKDTNLYIKYDLHPLFKDSETTNVSLGIRFDL